MPGKKITSEQQLNISNTMFEILHSLDGLLKKIKEHHQENEQYVINFMDELNKRSIEF